MKGYFAFPEFGQGSGGDGGEGGAGGTGGSAGAGGTGERGVMVDIVTDDVRLLCGLLLHTRGGKSGATGLRGKKGSEGQGGRGGVAAHGGRAKAPGISGRGGKNGAPGLPGLNKEDGHKGGSGQVRYLVVEKGMGEDVRNRKIIDCGLLPPCGKLHKWEVKVQDDDGILEPGEELFLENVVVSNGEPNLPMLTLPPDADIRVSFPNEGMELQDSESLHYIAEPIEPGNQRVIETKIGLRVPFPPLPTKPGPFISKPKVMGQVGMLCWESSDPYSEILTVQWPVGLGNMTCPSQLSRNERGKLEFSIFNLCEREIKEGCLEYKVVEKEGEREKGLVNFVSGTEGYVGAIDVNSKARFVKKKKKKKKKKKRLTPHKYSFEIEVEVVDDAPIFMRANYDVKLYYKERMIEFGRFETRVTPIYDPIAPRDLLFFSNKHQSFGEMRMWLRLLSSFDLGVQFWDLEKYGGMSAKAQENSVAVMPHNLDWADGMNYGKLLVFPLSSHRDLATMEGENFIDHFQVFFLLLFSLFIPSCSQLLFFFSFFTQAKKNPEAGGCLFTGVPSSQVVGSIFRTSKKRSLLIFFLYLKICSLLTPFFLTKTLGGSRE